MRPLAIARFRLWTTVRAATPVFLMALAPPLIALIVECRTQSSFLADADEWLRFHAIAALVAWLVHGFMIVSAAMSFGGSDAQANPTAPLSNLMDSAPLPPRERFFGEACGIVASALIVHICCLPLLAVVAALSPLPTRVFAWIEAALLAAVILAGVNAAWRRVGPRVNPRTMRATRTVLLFFMFVMFAVIVSTDAIAFRDALFAYVGSPSMRSWAHVKATVNSPTLLIMLLAYIYFGYLTYFYVSASRMREAS